LESDIKSRIYHHESIVNNRLLWIDIRNLTREKMDNFERQYIITTDIMFIAFHRLG